METIAITMGTRQPRVTTFIIATITHHQISQMPNQCLKAIQGGQVILERRAVISGNIPRLSDNQARYLVRVTNMRFICRLLFVLLTISAISFANEMIAQGSGPKDPLIRSRAWILDLCAVALRRFELDQPEADKKHFSVTIRDNNTSVDVSFAPDQESTSKIDQRTTSTLVFDNPGGNRYGKFVVYSVSKMTGKIVKTTYAK